MKEFNNYNLNLISDFPVKIFKDREEDLDLIIPIENRTVNLCVDNMPQVIASRIQYSNVNSLMIRISKEESNNIGTVHFLSDEGAHSTMSNFEIDYGKWHIKVLLKEYSVDMLFVDTNCPLSYDKI